MSINPNTSASWQPEPATSITPATPATPASGGLDVAAAKPDHRLGAYAGLSTGARGETGANSASVVLFAETARISTVRRPTHRVHVRREILTEEVTVTVTVRREVLHVEQTPIGDDAAVGRDLPRRFAPDEPYDQTSDDVHRSRGLLATGSPSLEVVLSQEVPLVSVRTVPYERVRLTVQPVVTTTTVDVDIRRDVADVATTAPDAHPDPQR